MHPIDRDPWTTCFIRCGLCAAVLIAAADQVSLAGDSPPQILRVEVDWEIQLFTPDAAKGTPELTFVLSPFASMEDVHSVFTVNHRDESGHQAGGFQNQVWSGETLIRTNSGPDCAALNTPGELIRFTHVMQIDLEDERVEFDVVNLQSVTWGDLTGNFADSYAHSSLTTLDQFSVTTTINETGVQAGGSCVDHVKLRRVRKYTGSGLYSDVGYYQKIYEGVTSVIQTVETVDQVGQIVPR